jgi:soluble lytic murein transglycosylase-like protein
MTMTSTKGRMKTAARAIRIGAAALAAVATLHARSAAAEEFRYVDREGRVHNVSVGSDGASVSPPPAALVPLVTTPGESVDPSGVPYLSYAREASAQYALPMPLLVAVMKIESGFNPRALSSKGAMGLMQLMPGTASDMGVMDPYDPHQSVLGGARFLRVLMDDFGGDLARVLAAYHAGAGRIHRSGGVIPFEETRKYVSNVLHAYGVYIVSGVGQGAGSGARSTPRFGAANAARSGR